MIEDDELRELFQAEGEEHLQTLDEGLLRLETRPDDQVTLEEVFRAAHSLKGTSRMIGVSGVELIAHHMEDELGGVRRGRSVLASTDIDRYSVGLKAMRQLVQEAVTGTPANVDLGTVLAQLSGEIPLETTTPNNAQVVAAPIPVVAPPPNAPEITTLAPIAVEPTVIEALPEPIVAAAKTSQIVPANDDIPDSAMEVGEVPNVEAQDEPREEFKIQTMRVPPRQAGRADDLGQRTYGHHHARGSRHECF